MAVPNFRAGTSSPGCHRSRSPATVRRLDETRGIHIPRRRVPRPAEVCSSMLSDALRVAWAGWTEIYAYRRNQCSVRLQSFQGNWKVGWVRAHSLGPPSSVVFDHGTHGSKPSTMSVIILSQQALRKRDHFRDGGWLARNFVAGSGSRL